MFYTLFKWGGTILSHVDVLCEKTREKKKPLRLDENFVTLQHELCNCKSASELAI